MTRTRATLIHLLLSILIASTALVLMLIFFYPARYFVAGGGVNLLTILVAVDVIIGPLLTWIVFKTDKKSLKMDLTIIVLLQLAALIYGIWVILTARPVFMALVNDRFSLVQANEIDQELLAAAQYPEFRQLSWSGPVPVVTKIPLNVDRQQEILMSALAGYDRDKFPELYHPYDQNSTEALRHADPVTNLYEINATARNKVESLLREHHLTAEQAVYLPVMTRRNSMTAVLHYETGAILGILNIDPWPIDSPTADKE